MEGTKIRPIDISKEFYISLKNIFDYGVELFGILQALKYENLIYEEIEVLDIISYRESISHIRNRRNIKP